MTHHITFIGGGNMATSLITGLIDSGYDKNYIAVADPNEDKRERFRTKLNIKIFDSNAKAIENTEVIILAVKPQDMKNVISDLKSAISKYATHPPLIISIAAGVQTKHIQKWFGGHPMAIVRSMPNTAALLRAGVTALYANGKVSDAQRNLAESILRAVGTVVWVDHEHDMDTITALSGSGPAYFFLIMDALTQSAESLGLTSSTAKLLTLQTALGAARMALESDISIDALIHRVASKGGATEKGLEALEKGEIRTVLHNALQKARSRAVEISEQFENE